MPKLGPTGSKTDQLEFADSRVLRGFSSKLLVGVCAEIALITQRSVVQIHPPQPTQYGYGHLGVGQSSDPLMGKYLHSDCKIHRIAPAGSID